eukprot:440002-Pyramimonas_sp.AAC.1
MRGVVVSCNMPTCRVGKAWRELDFFVVSHELVGVVRACERLSYSANKTHSPVRLSLGTDAHLQLK